MSVSFAEKEHCTHTNNGLHDCVFREEGATELSRCFMHEAQTGYVREESKTTNTETESTEDSILHWTFLLNKTAAVF